MTQRLVKAFFDFCVGVHVPIIILFNVWPVAAAESSQLYYYLATLIAMGATAIFLIARHWYGWWGILSLSLVAFGGGLAFVDYFYISGRVDEYILTLYTVGVMLVQYLLLKPIPSSQDSACTYLRIYDLALLISVLMLWMTLEVYQVPVGSSMALVLVTYYAIGDIYGASVRLVSRLHIISSHWANYLSAIVVVIIGILTLFLAIAYVLWPPQT